MSIDSILLPKIEIQFVTCILSKSYIFSWYIDRSHLLSDTANLPSRPLCLLHTFFISLAKDITHLKYISFFCNCFTKISHFEIISKQFNISSPFPFNNFKISHLSFCRVTYPALLLFHQNMFCLLHSPISLHYFDFQVLFCSF